MPTTPGNSGSSLIPCPRYRDAARAIDWLCQVFGFERHLIVSGPDDTIAHAQLSNGRGMIMLRSAGRGFTCRDLEGHIWSVGTYDPWQT